MIEKDSLRVISELLEGLLENQKAMLVNQTESLSMLKEQFQLLAGQREIQARAQTLQEKSSQYFNLLKKVLWFLVVAAACLMAVVLWLLRRFV